MASGQKGLRSRTTPLDHFDHSRFPQTILCLLYFVPAVVIAVAHGATSHFAERVPLMCCSGLQGSPRTRTRAVLLHGMFTGNPDDRVSTARSWKSYPPDHLNTRRALCVRSAK